MLFLCHPSYKNVFVRITYTCILQHIMQKKIELVKMYKFVLAVFFFRGFIFVSNIYLLTYLIIIDNTKSKSPGKHVAKAILDLQVTIYLTKLSFKADCSMFKFANYISVLFCLVGKLLVVVYAK